MKILYSKSSTIFGNKWLAASLTLVLVAIFSTSNAYAHAKLIQSQPADGETLQQVPKTIELTFNKELQTVEMNAIVVTDQNGRRVDKDSVIVSADGKRMQIELAELSAGAYTVEWKALSADDHSIKGSFSFQIALSTANSIAPTSVDHTAMNHEMPTQESGSNSAQSVVRWFLYLAMMTLFGGFAFQLLILKPSLRQAPELNDDERGFGLSQGENRFVMLTWLSLAVLAVASLGSLVLQTSSVLGTSVIEAIAPSRLLQVLTGTSFGPPWMLQFLAMLALLAIFFFVARGRQKDRSEKAARTYLCLCLGICALLFLTPSLTGHARAAAAEYSFAIFSDWLHLVAVGFWVGGLFHLVLTMPASIAALNGPQRLRVLSSAIPRFSRLAVASTILIVLTGMYNSWSHVGSFSALWNTTYGWVLLAKIGLFVPMLAIGALNTFILLPRAKRRISEAVSENERSTADRSLKRAVKTEAALGAAVLLLTSFLAFLPPAREHQMIMTGSQSSTSPVNLEPRNGE